MEKAYAFAEFITPEDATAALAFDGVTLHGTTLKIRRPKDFVSPSVSTLKTSIPIKLNISIPEESECRNHLLQAPCG